jgi:hypothetical protein
MDKLFDFKFDYLIAKTVLKVLYAILVALWTIATFVGVLVFASKGLLGEIIAVVGSYLILLLVLRVLVEDRLVKFRMAEDINEIRKNLPPLAPIRTD